MKNLVFTDGSVLEVADNSTIDEIIMVFDDYTSIDNVKALFTRKNMVKVTLGDESYVNRIPTGINVGGDVVARFYTRGLTTEEIIASQAQQITELQEAIAEMLIPDDDIMANEEEV